MSNDETAKAPPKELHPIFRDTPAEDAPLWRYMSFAGLAAMLQSGGVLRFTRLDKFSDHFEGQWPQRDVKEWSRWGSFPVEWTKMEKPKIAATCWIDIPHESTAMWGLYAPGPEGVAIRTTFGKLRDVVQGMDSLGRGTLAGTGRVKYVDHFNDSLIAPLKGDDLLPNGLVPFMMKHKSYEHEHEVRGLVNAPWGYAIEETGLGIGFDPASFIDEVVVSPSAGAWFEKLVRGHVQPHGISNVRGSSLDPRRS
jgi:hypothetical protein